MQKKKVGILGSGDVGQSLAKGFYAREYELMIGSRNGTKAAMVDTVMGRDVATGTFREVAAWGELIILAVKGSAAEGLVGELADSLANKTVIDVTNPIADGEPENGVLKYFTSLDESLAERLQAAAPEARIVKTWNSVGHSHMIDPDFDAVPTMPLCGDNEEARKEVAALLLEFGWEPMDMGTLTSARAIEPLAMLWCIPGFLYGTWDHALKMLRK